MCKLISSQSKQFNISQTKQNVWLCMLLVDDCRRKISSLSKPPSTK